jgi:hypothetical protein
MLFRYQPEVLLSFVLVAVPSVLCLLFVVLPRGTQHIVIRFGIGSPLCMSSASGNQRR